MVSSSYSIVRIFLSCALMLALSACGGGGGGGGSTSVSKSSLVITLSSLSTKSSSVKSVSSISVTAASDINPGSRSSVAAASSAPAVTSISSIVSVLSSSSRAASSAVSNQSSLIAGQSSVVSSKSSVVANSSSSTSKGSVRSSSSSSSVTRSSSSSSTVVLTSVSISVEKNEMVVGETMPITVTGSYSDGHTEPHADAFWFLVPSGIISIDGRTITALHAGQVMIGADALAPGGGSIAINTLNIIVKEASDALLGLHLNASTTTPFVLGDTRTLSVTGDFTNVAGVAIPLADVSFDSSDSSVATVVNGVVSGVALGKVKITATYQGQSAAYDVEVVPGEIVPTGITFHVLKPTSWKNTINAHWFAPKVLGVTATKLSTFPGTAMQDLDADGWYDITLPGLKEINLLFNDGGTSAAGFHQTADQYMRKGGWFVLDEFPNPAGKYYGTWYDSKPELPQQVVCDVKTFGAKGDGTTKDTVAIQKAIDACAGKNGIVRLHDGKFVSGTIVLKSDMTLRIEPTATLFGTRDTADYPDQPKLTGNSQYLNCRKALVYSQQAKNIRIDGGGTIDGNGGTGSPWMTGLEATRPMAIFLVQTDGIVVQNITIKNSAMWTFVPFESKNIVIRGVTVQSLEGGNRDGIDPVDSQHVLIEAVDISSQDDSICLKSGNANIGVLDVMVRYSIVRKSLVANGLKFGTATKGPFKDITFDNITLENVKRGGIAVESVDGSAVSNVVYRNITMSQVGTPFYVVLGDRSSNNATLKPVVGSINNITFENILATDMAQTYGSYISGVSTLAGTFKLTNLVFKNVDLTFKGGSTNFGAQTEFNASNNSEYPDPGPTSLFPNKKDMPGYLYFRHVDNLTLTNVKVSVVPADKRPLRVNEDVSNVVENSF